MIGDLPRVGESAPILDAKVGGLGESGRRFVRNRIGLVGAIWLMLLILTSVLGLWIGPDPNHADVTIRLQPPSATHWFGTDDLGRDILARVLAGGRVSLVVSLATTVLAFSSGIALGTLTGYVGGLVDEVVSRVFDILVTIPGLLIAIMIVAAVGPSLGSLIVGLAIGEVAFYGRLCRAGSISVRNSEFVQGVLAIGMPARRIITHHVVPNIIIPVTVIATGALGRVALAEAGLSFLGAGVQPPGASWGNMIAQGQPFLQYAAWFPLVPGAILISFSIAFSFVGDALRDAFDLRESGEGVRARA